MGKVPSQFQFLNVIFTITKQVEVLTRYLQLVYIVEIQIYYIEYNLFLFFGIGKITYRKKNGSVYYTVNSINYFVKVIIPHFDKYPLINKKQADYVFFKIIVYMMYKKEHLNLEGLQKVVNLKSSMNKGSTPVLLNNFPNLKRKA
jgi:hypothetical protein